MCLVEGQICSFKAIQLMYAETNYSVILIITGGKFKTLRPNLNSNKKVSDLVMLR